jgi:hypothetical protein
MGRSSQTGYSNGVDDVMKNMLELETKIADLNIQRMNWKWAPDNPLQPIEERILSVLEEVISIYSDAAPEQRDHLRKMLQKYPAVQQYLRMFVTGSMIKLHSTVPPTLLQRALLAVSIENDFFGDYRDVLVMLGNLWQAAADAGIDPLPYFKTAASTASTETHRQGGKSLRDILSGFDTSAYFKDAVEPYLSKPSSG